ncbi:hypothetical protein ACP70R_008722 [Stipagrostis hirtigluma subsp. patula]
MLIISSAIGVVNFRSLGKPKDDDFSLELSKLHTYDDVVEKVTHQLGADDPAKIRLTAITVALSSLNHSPSNIEE